MSKYSFPKYVPKDYLDKNNELKKTITELETLLKNFDEKIAFFIGAGVSRLYGYPLWSQLAEKMIDDCWENKAVLKKGKELKYSQILYLKELSINEPISVMDYLKFIDENYFYKLICKFLKEPSTPKKEIYNQIRLFTQKYKKCIYICPNIEKSLQEELGIKDEDVAVNSNFLSIDLPPRKLSYIHGRLSEDENEFENGLIFTREQYNNHYLNPDSKLSKYLVEIFKVYTVIFIGYSLRDYEILQSLYLAKAADKEKKMKHYIFTGYFHKNSMILETMRENIKNNYGIHTIYYDLEEKGYNALTELIDEIDKKLTFDHIKKAEGERVEKDAT